MKQIVKEPTMDELLKKLLSADVLTEDTRQELEEAFNAKLNEAVEAARAQATIEVTAQLNEQWIKERDILIETIDEKVTEAMVEELAELREDIERFRDLEAEYATKLVEAKQDLATKLNEELNELTTRIDTAVEIRLVQELAELQADIEQNRKNTLGKKVFEAFMDEFKQFYKQDDEGLEARLTETEKQLEDAMNTLAEVEAEKAEMVRAEKLREVLAPLSGRTREVMEAILRTVETPLLESAYETFIGRVMRDSTVVDVTSEKEDEVLAESDESQDSEIKGTVITGDNTDQLNESAQIDSDEAAVDAPVSTISSEEKARLRRLAGIA
jgi:hypothetical protein